MKSHRGQSQQLVGGDFNMNEYPTLKENVCASIHVCVRRNVTKRKKCECKYICGYVYVVASVRVCVCVCVCMCARANVFECTYLLVRLVHECSHMYILYNYIHFIFLFVCGTHFSL